MRPNQTRTYERASSVVFLKTDELFGGLSNMAGGFPLWVNGTRILTSEALYQACRFPHRPAVQALIIEQRSPMTAKMKSKPYRHDSRPDWDQVRIKIMRWCLRVKLAQNWHAFSELLLETGDRPIVEESRKDAFWGAKATDDGNLVGMNVLGRLLMELREAIRVEGRESLMSVLPLAIPNFLLGGRPIEIVASQGLERDGESGRATVALARGEAQRSTIEQRSLFDAADVKEAPPGPYAAVRAQGVHVAGLKPYAEYKDSGLPWLGQVPGHWSVQRTKWQFRNRKELNANGDHANVLSLTLRGVVNNNPDDPEGLVPKDYRTYQFFAKGDLVFKLIDLENLRTSRVGLVHEDGIMSSAYVRLVPASPTNMRYFFHQFYDLYSRGIYNQLGAGVRSTLGPTDLLNVGIAIPPPDEQAAIVRFLDWANGRLDRAIRAKRKVIALLNEQKQAIIHRAVTRGLDPSVPLKPSGIPWLGDIPQHWEVSRIKNEFRCLNTRRVPLNSVERGAMTARTYDYYGASGVIDKVDDYIFDDELLLIAEDGANLVLRNLPLAIIARGKFWVNNHAHILKPRRGSILYLAHVLETLNYKPWISGAAQPKLTQDRLMSISIAISPPEEQVTIVKQTSEQTRPLVTAISRLEREIELLREYRTRLVADVVTGKLDVREAALLLPDEAPPDTAEDAACLPDRQADLGDEIESEAEGIEA